MNKVNYYDNKVSYHLSPHQGVVPEFEGENPMWAFSGNNIYNTNSGNVGIGFSAPLSALDVRGSINTSQKFTINYINIAPPVGSIMAYTCANTPDGWLLCDGSTYTITSYPGLFDAIHHTFDNYTNTDLSFNVPDYRGAFLRGTGRNDSVNGGHYAGPLLNAAQGHATQTHSHTALSGVNDPGHVHAQTSLNDDYNFTGYEDNAGTNYGYNTGTIPSVARCDSGGSRTWNNINDHVTNISVSTTVDPSTTNVDTNETRPYNYGVWWIIKY